MGMEGMVADRNSAEEELIIERISGKNTPMLDDKGVSNSIPCEEI
jgi:hypothetical protein